MFTTEWVGTANATTAGWGNLGGGVAQILVGSVIFPLLTSAFNGDTEKAWRVACVFPASIGIITAFCVLKYTDDSPKGNFAKLKKQKQMGHVDMVNNYRGAMLNYNTWLLFIQYACCFGVELTMNNAAALYFKEKFMLSTESAAAIASIFGWMHLFARALGGYCSDLGSRRWGMRGRLACHSFVLFMGGATIVVFANASSLGAAIAVLVIFSIFIQAAEGTSFA
jgi:NNP family nitrate/nitrite transporter-like MFS transporter